MRDLASPVAAFVRESCRIEAAKEITIDDLYAAYCLWAADNGHAKPTKQNFGRFLAAAVPSIRVARPRDGEARRRRYRGIDLMHPCAHCGKPPDGTEEFVAMADQSLWVHPQCQRFYGEPYKV